MNLNRSCFFISIVMSLYSVKTSAGNLYHCKPWSKLRHFGTLNILITQDQTLFQRNSNKEQHYVATPLDSSGGKLWYSLSEGEESESTHLIALNSSFLKGDQNSNAQFYSYGKKKIKLICNRM